MSFGNGPNGRKETLVPKIVSSYPHLAVSFCFYLINTSNHKFGVVSRWWAAPLFSSQGVWVAIHRSGDNFQNGVFLAECWLKACQTQHFTNECRVMHVQQICHSTFMTLTKETLRWFTTPEPFSFKIKRKKTSIGLNEFIEIEKISIQKSCHRI